VLHDIGKVEEYQYTRSLDTSDEGRLLGHIVMETTFVNQMINHLEDFPQELRLQLLHLLISHHGKMEFGSPKEPMTLEALALSYLDDLDSKLQMMQSAMDQEATAQSPWTSFLPAMERYVYRRRVE
jgi:3'-5' exoribonuclease